jgi:hypothetical protein
MNHDRATAGASDCLFRRGLALVALACVCLGAGCQTAHVREPLNAGWSANDPHARTEFWYGLTSRPLACNDEVFHGLILYLDGTDRFETYPARVAALKARAMLPITFAEPADEVCDRGTLAVALVCALRINGGLTMHLFGAGPRYAVRALEYRGIYPPSSPNQGLSGGEFVGVMQKAEEFEHGSPADAPAALLPGEIRHEGGPLAAAQVATELPVAADSTASAASTPSVVPPPSAAPASVPAMAVYLDDVSGRDADSVDRQTRLLLGQPLYLADGPAASEPATLPVGPKRVNVIVTGVEGDSAEVRTSESDPWKAVRRGMVVHENAEFRTGPKSAVRFIIPPDQTFCIDCQSSIKVLQAVAEGRKMKTEIGLPHGRVRYDVAMIGSATRPVEQVRIEEAGLEHDAAIRSPNSALALRGTKVSLFEQPSYTPEAVSLSGRAIFINTNGQRVPFGGAARANIRGNQTSAAEQADASAQATRSAYLARSDFENREIELAVQRGGFVRGDVIVGDLHLTDFAKLPGALDFVLQWTGGPQHSLNDLNLAVFSPLSTAASPDFVANPPFTVSLTPNSPASQQLRQTNYPAMSPSGGKITANSVGPDGLEVAYWPKTYPPGTYRVVVFNLVDANPPPTQTINPVTYTVDVFLNGHKLINTFTGSVGLLQTSPALAVPVPASAQSSSVSAGLARAARAHPQTPKLIPIPSLPRPQPRPTAAVAAGMAPTRPPH